jgi:eukaryotic-like serine/threonine-protein kinase
MSAQLEPFLQAIRDSKLLDEARVRELESWATAHQCDPSTLAKEIGRRGWLTAYQLKEIYRGRGAELILGPFVLLELLGEGGMGRVFKAQQTRLGRIVALKVIRREKVTKPQVVLRFHQEITAASKLSHPNVAFALDADEADGLHYFAMEYVEGIDLTKLVRERGQLPVHVACEYIRQAAIGLQHAFEKGLVHRDVKPSNLIVTPKGQVKVLDLGLAMLYDNPGGDDGNRVTQEGLVLGTPDFLAPEQAQNPLGVDIRADVYALGATLYYLLTARVPYEATSPTDKLLQHVTAPPPSLLRYRPDAPPQLDATIQWLMAKRPEDRPQTPSAVAMALQPFCPSQTVAMPQTAATGYTNATVTYQAGPATSVPVHGEYASEPPTVVYPQAATPMTQVAYAPPQTEVAGPLSWQESDIQSAGLESANRPTIRIRQRPEQKSNPYITYGIFAVLGLMALSVFILIMVYAVPSIVGPLSPPNDEYTNNFGMKLNLIKPGSFTMGSADGEPGHKAEEGPTGSVQISQPYYIGVTEVTYGQYYNIMKKSPPNPEAKKIRLANQAPVDSVTWNDAVDFCRKLNELDRGKRQGWLYRLPTEAEWEYACRGGTTEPFAFGDKILLNKHAIFDLDEEDRQGTRLGEVNGDKAMGELDKRRPHPVGSPRIANGFGLFDMHGNVWEWCSDFYEDTAYSQRSATDPSGPATGNWHSIRGGSWGEPANQCRSATRRGMAPDARKPDVGFRVVLAASK